MKKEHEQIRLNFREKLGEYIRNKREQKSISQSQIANELEINTTTYSNYESGTRDMPVSYLPLLSAYFDFELNDFFVSENYNIITDTFKLLSKITGTRYIRTMEKSTVVEYKPEPIGYIYMEGDKEHFEYFPPKPQKYKKCKPISQKELILSGQRCINAEPYTDEEFYQYLMSKDNGNTVKMLKAAKSLLECMNNKCKKSFIDSVALQVIENVIVDDLTKGSYGAERAYAYYRKIIKPNN
mgnify:FL=1|jgi:transcriptional regulator with XRE-family HTH domain